MNLNKVGLPGQIQTNWLHFQCGEDDYFSSKWIFAINSLFQSKLKIVK